MILETVYRAGGFKRVLLFARDRAGKALRLRLGFGDGAEDAIRAGLVIPCEGARDVFGLSLSKGADVALENLSDTHIRPHVPAWHAERLPARGMLLFPVIVRERPVALLYADADRPEPLRLTIEERDLLKTLRNQAGLAFKQAG
jgi:GAF domain-containing protein